MERERGECVTHTHTHTHTHTQIYIERDSTQHNGSAGKLRKLEQRVTECKIFL